MHQATKAHSSPHRGAAGRKIDETTSLEFWEVADPDLPNQGALALLLDGERETWVADALYNIETLATAVSDGIETLEMGAESLSAMVIKSRANQLSRMMWILMQEGQRAGSLLREGKPMKMGQRA